MPGNDPRNAPLGTILDPTGIRDVQGVGNNVSNPLFGNADQLFPRVTTASYINAQGTFTIGQNGFSPIPVPTSYAIRDINLYDASPRIISNLIADQSDEALTALGYTTDAARKLAVQDDPSATPDGRVSPLTLNTNPLPYSGFLSLVGQFFDHGVDFVRKGADGLVMVPLLPNDPLYNHPDNQIIVNGVRTDQYNNFILASRSNLADTITGGNGNDTLISAAGNDTLFGGAGNDALVGGTGADSMNGGDGSDIYVLGLAAEYTGDSIIDTGSGPADNDQLRIAFTAAGNFTAVSTTTGIESIVIGAGNGPTATASTTNGINVNASALLNAILITGNGGTNALTGTAFNDTMDGGAGNDTLNGGNGDDFLTGGAGIDTFTVASGIDTITDLGLGGVDILTVAAGATANATLGAAWTASAASVNRGTESINANGFAVNLAAVVLAGTNGFNVTNSGAATTLTGSGLADTITGGNGNDTLISAAGNDTLFGGAGNDNLNGVTGTDMLNGGLGNDTLTGGAANDRFVFSTAINATTNLDTVTDFVTAADSIWLDTAIFTALVNNTLGARINANQFVSGAGITAATTLDQHLIYNTTSGALYYDADGSDVGVAAIQIALIGATIHPTLVANDIYAY